MSIRNLDRMFRPRSVAVIGASDRPHSVGAALMRNLTQGGFEGPVVPVNPRAAAVHGIMAYKDVAGLPIVPDLAVIATPPDTIAPLIDELGRRGTRAAVILTAGFAEGEAKVGREREAQLLNAARPYLLRIVGPNCLGIAVPGIGLNATFAPASVLPGNIAFLTQSGAMATTVLDWALPRGIGFSAIVSMGDMSDVDFGDLLDYFALDDATEAILIYAEGITHARKFMSAARRAARIKPVIVVKSGRAEEGARAATSHTGALAGADVVYEAAFRRAGMLRVNEVEELFDAAATLARMSPHRRRPPRHRHQWRRRRRAGDRPADRGGRQARAAERGHRREAQRRAAVDLEPRQSGRHHRRRRCRALCARGRRPDAGRRCRRAAGVVLPDRHRLGRGRRQGPDRRARQAGRARRRTCSPAGWARPASRAGRAALAAAKAAGFRDAGARRARLHVSGALPPEPGTAAGDAVGARPPRRPIPSARARWCAARSPTAASGSTRPNARRSSPATACRSRAPRRSPTRRPRRRSPPRSRGRWRSRSARATSPTSPTSAASRSTSTRRRRSRRRRGRCRSASRGRGRRRGSKASSCSR